MFVKAFVTWDVVGACMQQEQCLPCRPALSASHDNPGSTLWCDNDSPLTGVYEVDRHNMMHCIAYRVIEQAEAEQQISARAMAEVDIGRCFEHCQTNCPQVYVGAAELRSFARKAFKSRKAVLRAGQPRQNIRG